eukprot:14140740-Alexandrium_andersonii.AAC.1
MSWQFSKLPDSEFPELQAAKQRELRVLHSSEKGNLEDTGTLGEVWREAPALSERSGTLQGCPSRKCGEEGAPAV